MNKVLYLFLISISLLMVSCSSEEKYQTSLVKDYELYLNGERWILNTGITTRPIFIYDTDGEFVANYSSHFPFVLNNGTYHIFATPNPVDMVPDSTRTTVFDDLIIPQFKEANKDVQISNVIDYSSPFNQRLKLNMRNRTGILRLKAKDLVGDSSYTSIKSYVTVQRSGYKIADSSFVESPMELMRTKITATGGMNFTEDYIIFQTKDDQNGATVRLEMLNDSGLVVRSLSIDTIYQVLPGEVTDVVFYLNGVQ